MFGSAGHVPSKWAISSLFMSKFHNVTEAKLTQAIKYFIVVSLYLLLTKTMAFSL